MAEIVPLSDLTQSTLEGTGVFDTLMRSMKAHLEAEFQKGRIKGTDYATVYLGSLEAVLTASLGFVAQRQKIALEAETMKQQLLNLQAEKALLDVKKDNALLEGQVLVAQKCKLDAEYDLLLGQNLKVAGETALLSQKTATERAQTSSVAVDADSVIGKQKALYAAQTAGFARDAEQKAAKTLIDTWNVRRTTDEGTVADATNKLGDVYVGRAVDKLLSGVGA